MIPQHGLLEISRSRLFHNVELIRRQSRAQLCATIKADAYGHGVRDMMPLLWNAGLRWIAVYTLDEALEVAAAADFHVLVLAPLLLSSPSDISLAPLAAHASQIRVNLIDAATARHLSQTLAKHHPGTTLSVHIQIDTGLTRGGADPSDLPQLVDLIASLPNLRLEGVFSHLSHGDVPGHDASQDQLAAFRAATNPLKSRHPELLLHLQNSGGTWTLQDPALDMIRTGIALYGLQPSTADPIPQLRPIARVTAPILAIHQRAAGTGVGYGHSFRTNRESRIAVVPVGYADGYPRLASNRGLIVQINDREAPVIGRISMDQITIDVTDVPAQPGDRATVISWNAGERNSLDALADAVGTIGYELATHFGKRLRRVIVD
jgi:alanine racemase